MYHISYRSTQPLTQPYSLLLSPSLLAMVAPDAVLRVLEMVIQIITANENGTAMTPALLRIIELIIHIIQSLMTPADFPIITAYGPTYGGGGGGSSFGGGGPYGGSRMPGGSRIPCTPMGAGTATAY